MKSGGSRRQIQEDARLAARRELVLDRAGHDVARRQRAARSQPVHEALAAALTSTAPSPRSASVMRKRGAFFWANTVG